MLSFEPYFDVHSGKPARFSKNFSAKVAKEKCQTFDGRVELFKDYYYGWYITPLKQNLREGTALVTAHSLFSLCDVLEQFRQGQASSASTTSDFIKSALQSVYGNTFTKNLSTTSANHYYGQLYTKLRNGLQHDMATRGVNVYLSDGVQSMLRIDENDDVVEIFFNVSEFLARVDEVLTRYVEALKSQTDASLIANFESIFPKIFPLI